MLKFQLFDVKPSLKTSLSIKIKCGKKFNSIEKTVERQISIVEQLDVKQTFFLCKSFSNEFLLSLLKEATTVWKLCLV